MLKIYNQSGLKNAAIHAGLQHGLKALIQKTRITLAKGNK